MTSGLSYRLRDFKPGNPAEIERMNLMFYHPQVMEAKGYTQQEFDYRKLGNLLETDKEMFSVLSRVKRKQADVSYAVADLDNHLVGWIWFYTEPRHPLPIKVKKNLGLNPSNSRIYQVSYQKLMSEGWPEELASKAQHVKAIHLTSPRKGVVVEGLRLALLRLKREYRRLYSKKRTLAIYAYVLPDNIASQKVLEKNGFAKEGRQYRYDGLAHDLWVRILR